MLDFLIFAVTVIVFLIVAVIYLYPGSKKSTTIPGPEPIDILEGNVPDIIACGSLHEFLCKVHEDYGPIVSFWIGPKLFVSIGSAKLFQEQAAVFDRGCDLFASHLTLIGEDSIQVTNGAEGRRRHAVYSKCFTPTAIKSFYAIYNKLSDDLIDRWSKWSEDEFIPLTEQMFAFTIRSMLFGPFGFNSNDELLVKRIHAAYDVCMGEIDQQFKGDVPEASGARIKRFNQHKDNLYEIISNAIKSYRQNPGPDGQNSHSLIATAVSLEIPESTMKSDLITIFIGGFHTSGSLLTWAIYLLSIHQDVQDRARDEVVRVAGDEKEITPEIVEQLTYLRQILNETLRWSTIGPFASRAQDTETVIGGHIIPASTNVVQALGVALHDPEVFPQPDKFDPERFSAENESLLPPHAFEPFGFAGKRKCLGYRFALAEASVMLAKLLRSNLRFTLAPDQVVTPKYTIACLPSDEIWIAAEQRKSSEK